MRNDPPPLQLLLAQFITQSQNGVERSPRLERPDALIILTLEKEPEPGPRRFLALERCARESRSFLRSRRDLVQCRTCQDGRLVNVWLDKLVRSLDGGGGEGTRGVGGGHGFGSVIVFVAVLQKVSGL